VGIYEGLLYFKEQNKWVKEDEIHWECSAKGKVGNGTKCWLESLKEIDHSQDIGVDRRGILKWILLKKVGDFRLDLTGFLRMVYFMA
jgi:hypothetical protein